MSVVGINKKGKTTAKRTTIVVYESAPYAARIHAFTPASQPSGSTMKGRASA